MGRFDGKTVVITGGSAGIGAAAARRFAAEGATLVLAARGAEALQAVADEVGGLAVPTDVGDLAQCAALLERAQAETGAVHVLVNNAGAHFRGPVVGRTAEEIASMVDVNLRAPLVLTRLAVPMIQAAGGGRVVQVASLAGRLALTDAATYSATKFGLRIFSRALRDELEGTGVGVSVVSPGPVWTDFILAHLEEVADITLSQPMSSADEVAALVVQAAAEGAEEYVIPARSRWLTTLGYLSPSARRALQPVMERIGRRRKAQMMAER